MALRAKLERIVDEIVVHELDGPPQAYFEIPLDYWATPNGEIEPEGHATATRLSLRVDYKPFHVPHRVRADMVIEEVRAKLRELGGGYIWWRLRPTECEDGTWRLRLGTSPALPAAWWVACERAVGAILG